MEKKIDNDLLEKEKNSESSDKPVTESSNTEHLEGSPVEEENAELTAEQQQDEALFAALEKSKKQKKKKKIIIIVVIVAVLLIAGIIGTILLRKKVTTQFSKDDDEVLSAKAEKGTISTLVSGSGMLVNVDTETVSVPSGVEVTEILVEYGDTVKEGDMLAVVDMSTVRTAMTTLQESIEDLDDEIADAKGDTVSSSIYPPVSGRIKKVYAQKGDLVEDVMGNHGALALMSLDGYMTGELQTDKLKKGDAIKAVRADGTELEASVKNVIGKKATILVSDDGPEVDEEVKIVTDSGNEIGKIKLSINNPLSITGYAGTINYVYAKENAKVSSYSPLFTLSNTSTTASYDSLLRTRSDYEETLVELMKLQRNGGLTAPISGSIYSVADLDEDTTEEILDIVTISPDKYMEVSIEVDEANILSLEVGQSADVTVSSISDDVMEGTVTEIDKTYTSGSYTATVTLEKKTGMIPGMTADVDIRIEGAEDTLLIPADALHQTSSGYYVYTSYNEETKEYGGKVDVIPGLSNSDQVEIKSGLTEGQTVYYVEEEEFNPFGGGGFPGGGNMPGGQSGGGFSSGGGGPSGGPPSGGGPSGGPGGR